MIPPLKSREEIPALLNSLGLIGIGVEVGVGVGGYSSQLLYRSGLSRLYSVDPWNESEPGTPSGMTSLECFQTCAQELWKYYPRSVLLRMKSLEAAELFQPNSLDFVYIDGNHAFHAVVQDLHAWWPKVRLGGIMAGHDYQQADLALAVDQFVAAQSVEFALTECDERNPTVGIVQSWIVRKPTDS